MGERDIEDIDAGNTRRIHLVWAAILCALGGWQYVAVWGANSDSLAGFYVGHFVLWVVVFLGIGAAVASLTRLFLPEPARWDRAYAIGALTVIVIQSWDRIERVAAPVVAGIGEFPTWSLGLGLALSVALLTVRLIPAFDGVRGVFFVLTAFLVGVHYLSVLQYAYENIAAGGTEVTTHPPAELTTYAPDVLVLVLDGYGRKDALLEQFGFDNSPFEAELASLGLEVVEQAKATYSITALSIAGLLDGRYVATGQPDDADLDRLHRIHSGDNRLFESLDNAGYDVHMYDNAWTFTRCATNVDYCYSGGLNEVDRAVMKRTPASELVPWLRIDPWIRSSVRQMTDAASLARSESERPRLIYLHSLIPHPPFQLSTDCRTRSTDDSGSIEGIEDGESSRASYTSQIECTNSLVLDVVKAMPRDAIIFITGDHGPRWAGQDPVAVPDASDALILNRIGILTAYRFPSACQTAPPDASLMVSSHHLFDCLGVPFDGDRQRDPAQPPRFFSQKLEGGTFSVTEITERISMLD